VHKLRKSKSITVFKPKKSKSILLVKAIFSKAMRDGSWGKSRIDGSANYAYGAGKE
jgi:hypothetical protein